MLGGQQQLLPLIIAAALACQVSFVPFACLGKATNPDSSTDRANNSTNSSKHTIYMPPWLDPFNHSHIFPEDNYTGSPLEEDENASQPKSTYQQARLERQQRKPKVKNPHVEAEKRRIIRDFVREHGQKIRDSRKHADLFDGSGYLLDLHEELREFEHRADKERESDRAARRKRRSADRGGEQEGEEKDEEFEEEFDNLSDALAHLNGHHQAESVSLPGVNIVFHDAEKYSQEVNVQTEEEEEEEKKENEAKRSRRSAQQPDGDEDYASRYKAEEEEDEAEAARDEARRHQEAKHSLERLDADLREFAQLLDDNAEMEQEHEATQQGGRKPFENYKRHLSEAYKGLVELRKIAGDLVKNEQTSRQEQYSQQSQRVPFAFLEKVAAWEFDADTLQSHVREMYKMHGKMNEL